MPCIESKKCGQPSWQPGWSRHPGRWIQPANTGLLNLDAEVFLRPADGICVWGGCARDVRVSPADSRRGLKRAHRPGDHHVAAGFDNAELGGVQEVVLDLRRSERIIVNSHIVNASVPIGKGPIAARGQSDRAAGDGRVSIDAIGNESNRLAIHYKYKPVIRIPSQRSEVIR